MRAREFINEETRLPAESEEPMRYTYEIPGISTSNSYAAYRFGVALARARSDADPNEVNPYMPEWTANSALGSHGVVAGFNSGIAQVIDHALAMTHTPGGKKIVSSPESEEPSLVNSKSPMTAFKGYPTKRKKKE